MQFSRSKAEANSSSPIIALKTTGATAPNLVATRLDCPIVSLESTRCLPPPPSLLRLRDRVSVLHARFIPGFAMVDAGPDSSRGIRKPRKSRGRGLRATTGWWIFPVYCY